MVANPPAGPQLRVRSCCLTRGRWSVSIAASARRGGRGILRGGCRRRRRGAIGWGGRRGRRRPARGATRAIGCSSPRWRRASVRMRRRSRPPDCAHASSKPRTRHCRIALDRMRSASLPGRHGGKICLRRCTLTCGGIRTFTTGPCLPCCEMGTHPRRCVTLNACFRKQRRIPRWWSFRMETESSVFSGTVPTHARISPAAYRSRGFSPARDITGCLISTMPVGVCRAGTWR